MAIFPGSIYKPITASKGRKRLAVYNRVTVHSAASEARSLHGYFDQPGIPDSHFYVLWDGTVEQYVDTEYNAFADLEGNDATVSIETQGGVNSPNAERFTPAQAQKIAEIYAWAVKTHGVPHKIATSSQPGAPSQGLAWHRLGVPYRGNWSDSSGRVVHNLTKVAPGYLQHRDHLWWSKAQGKECPGDAKIAQISEIFNAATAILGGAPKPEPTPVVIEPEDDEMGFYVKNNEDPNAAFLYFNEARGKVRVVSNPEWEARRSMQTGAKPVVPLDEPHAVAAYWYKRLLDLGTY